MSIGVQLAIGAGIGIVLVAIIIFILESFRRRPNPVDKKAKSIESNNSKRFPGVLWILPIFFGFLGGVIAALISSLKYNASWWELLIGGIIVQITFGALLFYIVGFPYLFFVF